MTSAQQTLRKRARLQALGGRSYASHEFPTIEAESASRMGRVTRGTIAGPLYGALLALLSFLTVGAGHGIGIPFLISSAPFGFPGIPAAVLGAPLLWAVVGALVADPGRVIPPGTVLFMHYVSDVAHFTS